jgi:hypothetical protein
MKGTTSRRPGAVMAVMLAHVDLSSASVAIEIVASSTASGSPR